MRLRWTRRAFSLSRLSLWGVTVSNGLKLKKGAGTNLLFYPGNGACNAMLSKQADTIILRRSDFLRLHDYALSHAPLRDFCLIRVPMKCGLRPGEIQFLRWERVDYDGQTLNVVDSKKHVVFPVPMDLATADYLRELQGDRQAGWVIKRDPQGRAWAHLDKPLSYEALEKIVKKWAKAAGCSTWANVTVYHLRHFFAANWAYPAHAKRPGNLHALSKMLRHKNLAATQVYLSRLVFFEDIQSEYNRLQSEPFTTDLAGPKSAPACGNEFFDRFCRRCGRRETCKFMDEALVCPWASGYRFFESEKLEKEEMSEGE